MHDELISSIVVILYYLLFDRIVFGLSGKWLISTLRDSIFLKNPPSHLHSTGRRN